MEINEQQLKEQVSKKSIIEGKSILDVDSIEILGHEQPSNEPIKVSFLSLTHYPLALVSREEIQQIETS